VKNLRLGLGFRALAFACVRGLRYGTFAVAALAILAKPAAAYIDPISGSVLIQIVAAAALAAVATVRNWGSRLRTLFRRGRDQPGAD
jgi:hypothetical protein